VGLFVNRIPVFQGAGYLEHLAVETVTRKRHASFMTLPDWALLRELARLKLTRLLHRRPDTGQGAAG
jgi:hypothetical protein